MKRKVVSITIDPALKKRLDKIAEKEIRSFSLLMEKIGKDYAEAQEQLATRK